MALEGQKDVNQEPTPPDLQGQLTFADVHQDTGGKTAIQKAAEGDGKTVTLPGSGGPIELGQQSVDGKTVVTGEPPKEGDPAAKTGEPPKEGDPAAKTGEPPKEGDPGAKTGEPPKEGDPGAKTGEPPKEGDPGAKTGEPPKEDDPGAKTGEPPKEGDPGAKTGEPPKEGDPAAKTGEPPKEGDPAAKVVPGKEGDQALPSQPKIEGDVETKTDGVKLRPELQKEYDEKLAAIKAEVAGKNFEFQIGRGEGPSPAMDRMRREIAAKAKAGQELTPQEKELAGMKPDEVLKEARRIRDRDFESFKPRTWYIEREKSPRWSEKEVNDKVAEKEKELRADVEKRQKELEEKEKAAAGPSVKQEGTNFFDPRFNELPKEGDQANQAPKDGPWADIVREQNGNFFDKKANELPADTTGKVVDPKAAADTTGKNPLVPDVTIVDPAAEKAKVPTADAQKEVIEKPASGGGTAAEASQFPSIFLAYKAFDAGGLAGENWKATNDAQKYLADGLKDPATKAELASVPAGILDGKASVGDAKPVNDFLKEKGLSFQIRELSKGELAFAGTLGLEGAWEGKSEPVKVGDKEVPGVVLKQESYKVGDQTVVKLYTKDGVTVYAMPLPEQVNGQQALAKAQQFTPTAQSERTDYNQVKLPMVSLDQTSSLDQLVGMSSEQGTRIAEAKMQTKIALDENGFAVKQGLAAIASRGLAPPPKQFVIDKPFLLWAVHEGGNGKPLFAVRADESTFKDPKQAK